MISGVSEVINRESSINGWVGARHLLKLLREQVRGHGSTQERLDQIVELIAKDFEAEVCSIYLMVSEDVLELYAIKGLRRDAVHQTRLKKGEGIVGHIAAMSLPMAVSDVARHPKFVFRPETGEERYQSMLGIPILRNGQALGVIAIQNVLNRQYREEEVEGLEIVAMVLAEMVSGDDFLLQGEEKFSDHPDRIEGICLTEGLAVAPAVMHNSRFNISRLTKDDPEAEVGLLLKSVTEMRASIDEILERTDIAAVGEQREVLETYRMFAADKGWVRRIADEIRKEGLSAEAAVQKVQAQFRLRMEAVSDPYLRERLSDLEDLSKRLMGHILGKTKLEEDLPPEFILVARNMGPAGLLDFKGKKLLGVVLEEGAPTSHIALVAQALEIPVIGQCRGALSRIRSGDALVLDASHDQLLIRPEASIRASFQSSVKSRRQRWKEISETRDLPPVTRDGTRIALLCNTGLQIDIPNVIAAGADGIGLYRTELPFMVRQSLPDVGEQVRIYNRVFDSLEDRHRIVFRTLDVGGDKVLPYWSMAPEENPAMGWRAIRIGLDRPALLRQQLRALIRAAVGRELNVMFPMIADQSEIKEAKALLDRELDREANIGGSLPRALRIGAMLEVPSLVWQLPEICDELDFLSIGSNDLLQFFFAADRGNPRLSRRFDTLNPSVLRMFRQVARICDEKRVCLTVCGDMAAHPLEAMALLGCGIRSLSMPPMQLSNVRKMLRSLDLEKTRPFLDLLLEQGTTELRDALLSYAQREAIAVDVASLSLH